MGKLLITTALESTWETERDLIFLGNWCLKNERKVFWKNLNHQVPQFHWQDYSKLSTDYIYLREFNERVLESLAAALNEVHSVQFSIRYWRILLGPWLTYFIHIVFERWESVRLVNQKYDIDETIVHKVSEYKLIPNDMFDFINLIGTDIWNHYIIGEICKVQMNSNKIKFIDEPNYDEIIDLVEAKSFKQILIEKVIDSTRFICSLFSKNNKVLIGSSYIGSINELILNLRLYQFPNIYRLIRVDKTSNKENANRLFIPLNIKVENQFEDILSNLLVKQIPYSFLEGYHQLIINTKKLFFPKYPKVIFTSNFLTYDSIAMAYTASMVEKGTILIHGQHGGYGIPAFMSAFEHEVAISDIFLSWGGKYENNIIPVGILKPLRCYVDNKSINSKNTLLLIRGLWPRYTFRLDSGCGLDLNHAISDSIKLVANLKEDIRNCNLTVRLYPKDHGFGEKNQWVDSFDNINLNTKTPINQLVLESRLIVYTYNIGTGFLEFMTANIPTILIWDIIASPVNENVRPFLERFSRAGVFFTDPVSASNQINLIWDNVEKWWFGEEIQQIRKEFCDLFAKKSENLLSDLEIILRNNI